MFEDVTDQAIEQANKLLEFLVSAVDPNWEKVFSEQLGENELELNLRNAQLALERTKVSTPVGAVRGGTGLAKDKAGLAGEDSQRAVRLLKQTGRLVQAGKGRGKALLVLSAEPVNANEFAAALAAAGIAEPTATRVKPVVEERPFDWVPAGDLPGLLRAATALARTMTEEMLAMQKNCADRDAAIQKLEGQVEELKAALEASKEELNRKEALAQVTNWH